MVTGVLTACTSDQLEGNGADTLNGKGEKTPLIISADLGTAATITRAGGDDAGFANGAELLVYLRHTTGGKDANGVYPVTVSDQAPRLVSLTCNAGGTPVTSFNVSYTNTASGTTEKLFWDDFSNSASADTDLRTAGHGLQSYYGYSGIEASAITNQATGVIDHSVAVDQSEAVSTDLLWSTEQDAVVYAHADKNEGGDHRTINIPFSHALSKVTINVIAGEDYAAGCLADTKVQIDNFNTQGTFTAPAGKIEPTAQANIKLKGEAETKNSDDKPTRTFTAMTVPHTNLSLGNTLATITDVAGNDYTIPVTQGIINAWTAQLEESIEEIYHGEAQAKGTRASSTIDPGIGWITKPGVNYVLNVTVAKTKITLSASLKDWDYVYADAKGLIVFEGDVTEKGEIASELQATGFDVYKNTVNTSFPEKSTTLTYTAGKWSYSPAIYWQNRDDKEYFRAIAPKNTTLNELHQGTDYLWGTSAESDPETAVSPRTGNVALNFEHAMSKITVKLETATGAAAVDLDGAEISISNLSTGGSINIVDGAITPSATSAEAISQAAPTTGSMKTTVTPINGYAVIPQTITDAAIMHIKLANGTTYKLQLNTCIDSNSTEEPKSPINTWQRGMHYTYTIHIDKEATTFRAMIKEWIEAKGNSDANLEWD